MTFNWFSLQGSVTALQYLLLNGAKINTRDAAGKTALLLAAEKGLWNEPKHNNIGIMGHNSN